MVITGQTAPSLMSWKGEINFRAMQQCRGRSHFGFQNPFAMNGRCGPPLCPSGRDNTSQIDQSHTGGKSKWSCRWRPLPSNHDASLNRCEFWCRKDTCTSDGFDGEEGFQMARVLGARLAAGGHVGCSARTHGLYVGSAFKAPVAQLDRVLPSEGRGHRFESCRVRQTNQHMT